MNLNPEQGRKIIKNIWKTIGLVFGLLVLIMIILAVKDDGSHDRKLEHDDLMRQMGKSPSR